MRIVVMFFAGWCGSVFAAGDWELKFVKTLADLPGGARLVEREAVRGEGAVRIQAFIFPEKAYRIEVADNPAPHRGTLGEAASAAGAAAGVNGGYFHADFRPVGLVVSGGETIHGFERAKLLSGVVSATKRGPRIERAGAFESKGVLEALQAGPFLVDGGRPTVGLEDTRPARRTVVATDGRGRWAVMLFSRVTLAQAARVLASREVFEDFEVESALNLDGGSSSGLWVALPERPFYLRELVAVRNFLLVVPK